MKPIYIMIILIPLLIASCMPNIEQVGLKNPANNSMQKCSGSNSEIKKCVEKYEEDGYNVKSLTFQD